jgi:glycerophosphoryl diester phosphodiesterase
MSAVISGQAAADAIAPAADQTQLMFKMSTSGAADSSILPNLYDTGSRSRSAAPSCTAVAQPSRWHGAINPDVGLTDPLISAHRGARRLAPENTLWAYRYAFAYEADLVEVDVRETADGHFVSFHDPQVDDKTDGTGEIGRMTYAQVRMLNAADYNPWRDSIYDPAQIASIPEVLALARQAGGGIEFDMKSVRHPLRLVNLVAQYGLLNKSYFAADPAVALLMAQAQPQARFIYNRLGYEPPELLYQLTRRYRLFGSKLAEFDAGAIIAIHDGCAWAMPHSYDAGEDQEGQQFALARALGADGVQTNRPDLMLQAQGHKLTTELVRQKDAVCLVNARNQLGLPDKPLTVQTTTTIQRVTSRGGCVALDPASVRKVSFAGDQSADPTVLILAP